MKKIRILLSVTLLVLVSLCGCGSSAQPDSVTVLCGGEAVDTLSVLYGAEVPALTAEVSPSSFADEVTWESSDAGVVRVSAAEDGSCTLKLLKTGKAKITATCGSLCATVKVTVEKNQDQLLARETAYTIDDTNYSVEKLNLYFIDQYESFVQNYGAYAYYYGLDTSSGLSGLEQMSCDYSEDGTWRGYFLEQAASNLLSNQALIAWADENGVQLEETDLADLDDAMEAITEAAETAGFDSEDAYLASLYGTGITAELYRQHLEETALALKAYNTYCDGLTYTEEALAEHYATLGYEEGENNYQLVSMRHILIKAEEDADGNCSEEAIAAAHEEAEELLAQWQSGERTEASFAELANETSQDDGSNTSGGLYEDIYQDQMVDPINEWLFAMGRKAGDTAVLDYDGSYVGTHVVYFVGQGQLYSTYLALSDLKSTDVSAWLSELTTAHTAAAGAAYDEAGLF